MQQQENAPDAGAFSYSILDDEAAKISNLVATVQTNLTQCGENTLPNLFALAQEFDARGEKAHAEFLYLHFIALWEKKYGATYPISFTGLREYARLLKERSNGGEEQLRAS